MNDDDLEDQLRRFRVSAPSPSLRARVVRGPLTQPGRRDFAIGWCVAAAVVMVASLAGWVSMTIRERRIDEALSAGSLAAEVEETERVLGPRGRDVVRLRVLADGLVDRHRAGDGRGLPAEE